MEVLSLIIEIILCVCAIALIVFVLCQKSDRSGMGALTGGSDSVFGKSKKKGKERTMLILTIVAAAIMFVLSFALVLIQNIAK